MNSATSYLPDNPYKRGKAGNTVEIFNSAGHPAGIAQHSWCGEISFFSGLLGASPGGIPLLARRLLFKKTEKRGGDTMIYLIIPIAFVVMLLASVIRPACRPN